MGGAIYRLIALPTCVPQSRVPGPIAKGPVMALSAPSSEAPSAATCRLGVPQHVGFLPGDEEKAGALFSLESSFPVSVVGMSLEVDDHPPGDLVHGHGHEGVAVAAGPGLEVE